MPYKLRKDIKIPEPPEGVVYRNLGTMEHNICDILAQRMKNRKASWSIKGANNLAKILASKGSKELDKLIDTLLSETIEEEKLEEIKEVIKLTVAQVSKKPKRSKIYLIRKGRMPFTNCARTNGRLAIKRMLEDKCASELKLMY